MILVLGVLGWTIPQRFFSGPGTSPLGGGGGTEGAALQIRVMVQFALGSSLHCDLIVPSRKAPDSRHDGG